MLFYQKKDHFRGVGLISKWGQGMLLVLLLSGLSCRQGLPEEVEEAYASLPERIDFNFHIKPLLADRCFKCHGPDDNTREAGLRLDLETAAFTRLERSGGQAFVKGKPGKSVAWQRIISEDPQLQMPPPGSNLSLSPREKALIGKWIEQGAEWKEHWAFIPPQDPVIPKGLPDDWIAHNPIDHFVQATLLEQELSPTREADKERLIRRLSQDLTGLPPTLPEIDAFIADTSPNAYEKLVDRLLDTDAHAERLAMEWLDVARYADSQGLHTDMERYNWPWRDWVINAFKRNMPYDEFITWQLAGDLLPNATRVQKLATAFHRNHPVTAEGGAINEEFRQNYVQDRANTTATAFLGLTMECATCHDHKFDPISQKEYYQFSAFFNQLKELGMVAEGGGASGPVLLLPEPEIEPELAKLAQEIDRSMEALERNRSELEANKAFLTTLKTTAIPPPAPDFRFPFESIRPKKVKVSGYVHRVLNNSPISQIVDENPRSLASGTPELVEGVKGKAIRFDQEYDLVFLKDAGSFELNEGFSGGAWVRPEIQSVNQTVMGNSGELGNAWRGWDLFMDSLNRPTIRLTSYWPHNYIQITADQALPLNKWHHLLFTYDGCGSAKGLRLYLDGKQMPSFIEYDNLYRSIVHDWRKREGWNEKPVMVGRSGRFYTGDNGVFTGSIDEINLFRKTLSALEIAALYQAEYPDAAAGQALDDSDYIDHFLHRTDTGYREERKRLQNLLAKRLTLLEEVPEIMVMEDMPRPRKTFVLHRGQYDLPREEVAPGTPQKVLPFSESLPSNRLGLAQWLVDPMHPLTARVTVNRYWQLLFGRGIVDTPHDFGTQGALPTHPELLDWLAIRFIESGWDVRALLSMMVHSATYRQSSIANPEQVAKDPNNLFLSRGPAYRLPAEMIRDNALAASGLLNQEIGGPSVKPYQPKGLWVEKTGPHLAYKQDSGDSLYRRSMYTFIRRTTPPPAMVTFDASNRSVCIVKRENTNTPLQALVLLNDPQFVEAARVLAERIQREVGKGVQEQIQYGFRLLCGRYPNTREMELMAQQYQLALNRFQKDPEAARKLLDVGEYPIDDGLPLPETAALAMVANTVMNFDEAYMKR